eukprot:jgi/Mesvir1/16761/Mv25530-RA.1
MKQFRVAADVKDVRLSVRAASTIPLDYYGKARRDTLRKIALMQGLRPFRSATRRELECAVYCNQQALRIQRWVRRKVLPYARAKRTIGHHLAVRVSNKEDPITMDTLPCRERVFKFVRPTRQVVGFDAVRLAEYIIASGRFEDPATRFPFTPVDLWRLDKQVRKLGFQRHSTLYIYQHPEVVRAIRDHESLVVGLDRIATDVVESMVDIVGGEAADAETLSIVALDYMPQWRTYVRQLRVLDSHAGTTVADTCIHRVRVEAASDKSPNAIRRQRLGWLEAFMTYYMLVDNGVAPGFTPVHPNEMIAVD